jgi:ribonuclease BN (tRNA processing enzyme)
MILTFHGTRGSLPTPSRQEGGAIFSTTKYGGNTTCVSVSRELDGKVFRIVIDCGSGAAVLGNEIVKNFLAGRETLNINLFFTHLHPDHTQGFPFFAPNYFKECDMHLFGMKALKKHIGMILEQTMLPPTFPIEYKDLKSKRTHYEIKDEEVLSLTRDSRIKSGTDKNAAFIIQVMQSYAPSHPQQGALYYRVTEPDTGRSAACIWDCESKIGGDKAVINFSRGCDVMVHDTQYTTEEYISDRTIVQGFGHSTYEMAIENAQLAGIKDMLLCTHYNMRHDDAFLDRIQARLDHEPLPFRVQLAREGVPVEV